jgi:hypothetical protein
MPNSFALLDVPFFDGPGAPLDTSAFGRTKTIVFDGPVQGRYVVEGSNDGGGTWDILIDDGGAQALYTGGTAGPRSFDCIIERVRVRSIGNGQPAVRPVVALGAPPLVEGAPIFGVLDCPTSSGLGAVFDLGDAAGAFKTFILRGEIPPGSRYTILGSIDGDRFDELLVFTSDQQGARPVDFLCRFLRVRRAAVGPTPVISFGSEGVADPVSAGPTDAATELTLSHEPLRGTSGAGEEVLVEFLVPFLRLPSPLLGFWFSCISVQGESPGIPMFRVRIGGTLGQPDGDEVFNITAGHAGEMRFAGPGQTFARPESDLVPVKVTGDRREGPFAALRGLVMVFQPRQP